MSENTNTPYKILKEDGYGDYEEKKSKFLAYIHPVKSEEEAQEFITSIKKKHYDARHNCSAYIIGPKKEIVRYSDDGEPQGTAGKPMLEVLIGADITNVVCVVTRYFGGILLGTGGLVRAYTQALQDALSEAKVGMVDYCIDVMLTTGYDKIDIFLHYFKEHDLFLLETEYGEKVTFIVRMLKKDRDAFFKDFIQMTNGQLQSEELAEGYFEI